MPKELSYPTTIKRHDCFVCGCHRKSHSPWWPDDEIHLFMGIPLCWSCATRLVFQYDIMDVPSNTKIDKETFSRYMMDMKKEANELLDLTKKSVDIDGTVTLPMERAFEEKCQNLSGLRIINLDNEKWFKDIVKGVTKDVDQYKGILFQTKLVVDKDYFKQGTPLFIEWIEGTLPDIKGTESYAMIDSVVSDGIWVIGDAFGSTGYKITIEHLMSGKIWIRKCIVPERKDK